MKVVIRRDMEVIAEHYDFLNFFMDENQELCVSYAESELFKKEVYRYEYEPGRIDFCVMPYMVTKK